MASRISPDDVLHVARLARLRLSDDELARFTEQLGDVLDHATDMAALDLDGVAPTAHPIFMSNVLREDVVGPTLSPEEVLSEAPASEDGMFRVQPMMGESE